MKINTIPFTNPCKNTNFEKTQLKFIDKNGDTALIQACKNKKNEIINKNGDNALILACYNNMSKVAIKLIETCDSHPEIIDGDNKTAIYYATKNKMKSVVLELIKYGETKEQIVSIISNSKVIKLLYEQNMFDEMYHIIKLKKEYTEKIQTQTNILYNCIINEYEVYDYTIEVEPLKNLNKEFLQDKIILIDKISEKFKKCVLYTWEALKILNYNIADPYQYTLKISNSDYLNKFCEN